MHIDGRIALGEFAQWTRCCGALVAPAVWVQNGPCSISTMHICACGTIDYVAHWSTQ